MLDVSALLRSAQLSNQLSKVKVDVIYPCTEKHVAKHTTPDNYFLLRETPELYKDVHEPYIARSAVLCSLCPLLLTLVFVVQHPCQVAVVGAQPR